MTAKTERQENTNIGLAIPFLENVVIEYPFRSAAIEILLQNLQEKHPQATILPIPTYQAYRVFTDDKCSFRFYRRTPQGIKYYPVEERSKDGSWPYLPYLNDNYAYSVDRALFLLVHPPQKEGSWISLAHHMFTTFEPTSQRPHAYYTYQTFGDHFKKHRRYHARIEFELFHQKDPIEILKRVKTVSLQHYVSLSVCWSKDNKPVIASDIPESNLKSSAYAVLDLRDIEWGDGFVDKANWDNGWKVFGIEAGKFPLLTPQS